MSTPSAAPMTGKLPRSEVAYRGRDDVALRNALFEVWKNCCFVCGRPQVFVDTQIDHIIPRTTAPARVAHLVQQHGLAPGFHVDRPRNLALICPGCNLKKSNRILDGLSVTLMLDTAHRHEAEVIRRVQQRATATAVARHLVKAATADIHDPKVKEAFRQHGPTVVRTLAVIDEATAADFEVPRDFDFDHPRGVVAMPVSLSLDADGRAAQRTIEIVGGCTLPDALDDALQRLMATVHADIDARVAAECTETSFNERATTDNVAATLAFRSVDRRSARLTTRFTGGLRGSYTAAVADTNEWGDGVSAYSVTVEVDLAFAISASWDLTRAPGRPIRSQAKITDGYIDSFQT